jgi:hypothetical protein
VADQDLRNRGVTRTGFFGWSAFALSSLVGVPPAQAAEATAGKGHVNHGNVAATPRPSGYSSVEWIGSVEPQNAVDGDTWVNTG